MSYCIFSFFLELSVPHFLLAAFAESPSLKQTKLLLLFSFSLLLLLVFFFFFFVLFYKEENIGKCYKTKTPVIQLYHILNLNLLVGLDS